VRTLGEEQRGVDLESIEIRSQADGTTVRLSDIARVRDTFVESDLESHFNGKPAANLLVQKTPEQDAIEISGMIKAFVAGKRGEPFDPYGWDAARSRPWLMRPFALAGAWSVWLIDRIAGRPNLEVIYEQSRLDPFDHTFDVALHTDLARFVEGRLDLMVRNGRAGLLLVLITLNLFLNWRVALWTAVGLPVSFLGMFIVMWALGTSINLLSMFGMIIVLGIIVDDAIVIGENIYRRVEEGMPSREAAIRGAEEVMWPVIIAVATTVAAFLPLLFIRGQIGDFMRELPIVVCAALTVSLTEALVVLPAHLAHLPGSKLRRERAPGPQTRLAGWLHRVSSAQHHFMESLIMPVYERFVRAALSWRYVTVAVAISTSVMSLGLFVGRTDRGYALGNIVPWEFVQKMDAESIIATLEMPIGSTADSVYQRLRVVSDAALLVPEVETVQIDVASALDVADVGATGGRVQPHLGQVWVELKAADQRELAGMRSSTEVVNELRRVSDRLSGINSMTWTELNGGPGGKDIEIRLSGKDMDELQVAARKVMKEVAGFAGVADLDENSDQGKREAQLRLRESARPTGVTVATLGRHVRSATYGAEARRITRNREDVRIMVRYPPEFREQITNLESMWIPAELSSAAGTSATPNGPATPGERPAPRAWIPMREVAELTESLGYMTLRRSEHRRAITVSGDIDEELTSSSDIIAKIRSEFVPKLLAAHPGIKVEFLGSTEEAAKAFGSLKIAFPVALMLVYMLLTGLFRSYFQPIVVMTAIPFGLQGAIVGHWVTGNPMTILSFIGLVALTGIVVNDSLVLVDFVNTRIREGQSQYEANVQGAKLRLRPILLTTLTTVAGLAPLMFERSFQAKFMIPMAVTLTWGLTFATALTLVVVPALNMIFFDLERVVKTILGTPVRADSRAALETAQVGMFP
jgi:multidrug efflux pump subunit AcrB